MKLARDSPILFPFVTKTSWAPPRYFSSIHISYHNFIRRPSVTDSLSRQRRWWHSLFRPAFTHESKRYKCVVNVVSDARIHFPYMFAEFSFVEWYGVECVERSEKCCILYSVRRCLRNFSVESCVWRLVDDLKTIKISKRGVRFCWSFFLISDCRRAARFLSWVSCSLERGGALKMM